jgi:hypothetical protein
MNSALEYSTRVVQEGGRRCKKSTLNDLVHLTPLRIPLMNPPYFSSAIFTLQMPDWNWKRVTERSRRFHKKNFNGFEFLTIRQCEMLKPATHVVIT